MTRFNDRRVPNTVMGLDIQGLRRGYYSDKYFANIETILNGLRGEDYRFDGESPREIVGGGAGFPVGDVIVEAQVFNRRAPQAVVAGLDVALACLRHASGYFQDDNFVETWQDLTVTALHDGDITVYNGDPSQVQTVLEIQGRYRDFAILETPILGYLTRASRIATNVYEVLKVANGKQVLFFPARFDLPSVQALDGYAYYVAIERYNTEHSQALTPLVSTDAQAAWWGGHGGGTVPHAIIACFLADTAESMRAFARHISPDVPRIVLADFNNDTVRDVLATLDAFWPNYVAARQSGDEVAQTRWTLHGVRLDTASSLRDQSLAEGDPMGVSPLLVETMRRALDNAWTRWELSAELEPIAQNYCRNVGIVVSGGFNADRVATFEAAGAPVDSYGVGSTFFENAGRTKTDYTMDVVRVKIHGEWVDMAKVGRAPGDHPNLKTIDLSEF